MHDWYNASVLTTDSMQKSDEKCAHPHRRAWLVWGLVISAGVLLSANLYDSIQYYLGHRMTTGHLLWSFADAHEWYKVAYFAAGSTAIFLALSIIFIFAAMVINASAGGAQRFEIGIGVCFMLLLIGMVVPVLRSRTNPSLTTCIDMQRQLAIAAQMSVQDHDYRFPTDWSTLDIYLGGTKNGHYLCPITLEPFHKPGGYGLNGQVAGLEEKEITDPKVFIFADSIRPEMILRSKSDIATRRHHVGDGRGFAVSYINGTAKFVPEETVLKWK